MPALHDVAAALVAPDRGILAADESIATMSRRLETAGVPASGTARRDYRELLLTTPGLSRWISGIIVCDETLRQSLADATPFPAAARDRGILTGIKVDTGVTRLPFTAAATVTQGLDGLRGRLADYVELGASFAKWRAVLAAVGTTPRAIRANAHALARYAALCQEAGVVPVVEPEVVMDGGHGVDECEEATLAALTAVFAELAAAGVDGAGLVLKPNMVLAGSDYPHPTPAEQVAARTLRVLAATVPPEVPGVAFLSGGQCNERACINLAAINAAAPQCPAIDADEGCAPWRLTFSFGRALVDDALRAWRGRPANVAVAQQRLARNCARASRAARPVPAGGAAIPAGATSAGTIRAAVS